MKRVICIILSLVTILSINCTTFAAEMEMEENTEIESVYREAYNECKEESIKNIADDYRAYAYLLNNKDEIVINDTISLSDDIFYNLNSEEKNVLENFVYRLNELVATDAIYVTDDLQIVKAEAPEAGEKRLLRAAVMEILDECERHADELQNVYDNALFGTAHIVAGTYFADRVKGGGIWDYKVFLGLNTPYTDPGFATMTGETIGNFHYGYVGSVCFGATTLKSLAEAVQLSSGTSSSSYWSSYFDDPKDQSDIQWGINVYNSSH